MEKIIIKDIKEIIIDKDGITIYQINQGIIRLNMQQILNLRINGKINKIRKIWYNLYLGGDYEEKWIKEKSRK